MWNCCVSTPVDFCWENIAFYFFYYTFISQLMLSQIIFVFQNKSATPSIGRYKVQTIPYKNTFDSYTYIY